jgi:hypothetical protein
MTQAIFIGGSYARESDSCKRDLGFWGAQAASLSFSAACRKSFYASNLP